MQQRVMHLAITPGTRLIISTGDDESAGDQFLLIDFTQTELKVTGLIEGNVVPGVGILHHEKFEAAREKKPRKR